MNLILTHPGSAHKDDFLACSLLIATSPVPIERRDPTEEEIEDPHTALIDIGNHHDPEKLNFDHHQFPRDHIPTCSLSLVLQQLSLYEDARRFCDWLEPAEWFDCRGAIETARHLGVNRKAINQLNSPIDVSLLRAFASQTHLHPGEPLWEIMELIGSNLIDYITSMKNQIRFLKNHITTWKVSLHDQCYKVLFIEKSDNVPDDARSGIGFFVDEMKWRGQVIGVAYPDQRGQGYGLSRFEDHQALDFTRVKDEDDVLFAHARGFLAKTTSQDPRRLQQLIQLALCNDPSFSP